jgi:hypothetical protein
LVLLTARLEYGGERDGRNPRSTRRSEKLHDSRSPQEHDGQPICARQRRPRVAWCGGSRSIGPVQRLDQPHGAGVAHRHHAREGAVTHDRDVNTATGTFIEMSRAAAAIGRERDDAPTRPLATATPAHAA